MNCWISLQSSGVYEAGGNAAWVDPETTGDTVMPGEDPPWIWVREAADSQFLVIESDTNKKRIFFPVMVPCWLRSGVQALNEAEYPKGGLVPLACLGLG